MQNLEKMVQMNLFPCEIFLKLCWSSFNIICIRTPQDNCSIYKVFYKLCLVYSRKKLKKLPEDIFLYLLVYIENNGKFVSFYAQRQDYIPINNVTSTNVISEDQNNSSLVIGKVTNPLKIDPNSIKCVSPGLLRL